MDKKELIELLKFQRKSNEPVENVDGAENAEYYWGKWAGLDAAISLIEQYGEQEPKQCELDSNSKCSYCGYYLSRTEERTNKYCGQCGAKINRT